MLIGSGAKYCGRHYQQLVRWGECRFSRGDKNQYFLHDDFAEIVLYDKDLKEKARAIIDIDDVESCKPYKWTLRTDGYVATKKNYVHIKLHRFIVKTPKGMHTDHKDRNRLNNKKDNLRICTQQENNKNKGMYSNNKSGYRGVEIRNTARGVVYVVDMKFESKDHYIGSYETLEEAVKHRREAELRFYGYVLDE